MPLNNPTYSSQNRSGLVIPLAIVLLGLALGYFYFAQFESSDAPTLTQQKVQGSFEKFRNFNKFDFSIFDNPVFKSLRTFGESPVVPGSTGKTDVFAPF